MKSTESKLLMETWRKFVNEVEHVDIEEIPGEMVHQDPAPAGLDRHLDEKSNEETELRVADGLGAEFAVLDRQDGVYMVTLYKAGEYDSQGMPTREMVGQPMPLTSVTMDGGVITKVMM